ncbi:MAG: Tim44/TimA family putative adaptor protein [Methylovirgula sp.]
MHDPLDASTIIFALLAIFVLWKLRSVLGSRTGNEKEPPTPFNFRRNQGPMGKGPMSKGPVGGENNVVPLPGAALPPEPPAGPASAAPAASPAASPGWGGVADRWKDYVAAGSPAAAGLDAIAAADQTFSIDGFVAGAKSAYEMIVMGFAAGDRDTLERLLDQDVFHSFQTAIDGRANRGETMKTTLVSIDSVTAEDAALRDKIAQITLRFATKLINATENSAGAVIDGSPDRVVDMIDIWTFARDSRSRDPNWKLIATQSGH